MHAYLADVLNDLDRSRARLIAAVERVPPPLRTRRPAPDRWSVAEVLEHVSLVESRFATVLAARMDEALEAGIGAERGAREPLPGPIAERLADRVNRRIAPETAIPTGSLDGGAALAAADRARAAVREAVLRGDGLALSAVTHSHPSFGELTIYQWVELIAAHARRHAEQIDEVRAQLDAAAG